MNRPAGVVVVLCLVISALHDCMGQGRDSEHAEKILTTAQKHYDDGYYKKAADTLAVAVEIFERLGNTLGLIRALNLQGENFANLNQCDKAFGALQRSFALATAKLKPDDPDLAQTYYFLSRATGGCARKFNEAIPLMFKSINMKKGLYGEGVEVAFDYTFLGFMYEQKGQYDSALLYLNMALGIREKNVSADDVELSRTYFMLGRTYESKGDISMALDFQQRSLRIRQVKLHPAHVDISNNFQMIGSLYQKVGNYDRALEYLIKALEIRRKSLGENHTNVASTYFTIGNLYAGMFNYHQAIHYIKRGVAIIESNYGEKNDVLPTYVAFLGSLYGHVHDHASALTQLKRAQAMAEKNLRPDHPFLGIVYNIIGEYYTDNYPASLKDIAYYKKAIPIFQKAYGAASGREADVLARMGISQAKNKNYASSLDYYSQAMRLYQVKGRVQNPKIASVHKDMGDLSRDQFKFSQALLYYQKALADVSGGFDDTTDLYVNPTSAQIDNRPLALRILSEKAPLIQKMAAQSADEAAMLGKAMDTYHLAMDLISEMAAGYNIENARVELQNQSRKIYVQSMATAYRLYTLTNDAKFIRDAFDISERSKAAILLEKIRDERAKMEAGVPDSLINLERDIKIELAWHKSNLRLSQRSHDSVKIAINEENVFDAQQKHEALKRNLEKQFRSYFNQRYKAVRPSVESVQRALPDETTAVIVFFVEDSAIYNITVRKNNASYVRLARDNVFKNLVSDYEKSLTDASFITTSRDQADHLYTRSANALYELLLKYSVEDRNQGITRLIIIPDDFLAQFNFSTLLSEKSSSETPDYRTLPYLARKYQISYAYAADFISPVNPLKSRRAKSIFAGFAPSYAGKQFAEVDTVLHPLANLSMREGFLPLPGAGEEVRLISRLMRGDSWLDNEASETNFKKHAGDYNILHLAMHSLVNNENPNYSELIFNHDNDTINDGYLNVAEIYNLKLNAALVVLSACSSGFGKIQKGEGPITISRAFSYAGCPSVVMTLWKIPDAVTSRIMAIFYEELKAGKQKDEAMRTAQLRFLSENQDPLYQHPYFWAGFVVMGDTDPLPKRFPWWIVLVAAMILIVAGSYLWYRRRWRRQIIPAGKEVAELPRV
jgi:CHAT domain-containing protein